MKGANPFFVPEISDGTPEDGKMNSENGLPHFDDIPMFGGSISNFGKFIWWSQLILQQLTSPTSGPPSCWTNQGFASASCGNARAMAPIPLNHDLMPKQTCIPYKCVSNICASPKNAYIHKKHYSIFMNDVCVCVIVCVFLCVVYLLLFHRFIIWKHVLRITAICFWRNHLYGKGQGSTTHALPSLLHQQWSAVIEGLVSRKIYSTCFLPANIGVSRKFSHPILWSPWPFQVSKLATSPQSSTGTSHRMHTVLHWSTGTHLVCGP